MSCKCDYLRGYDNLEPGMTVKVFLEQKNGTHKLEGDAILVKKLNTWYSPEPFPIIEKCEECKQTVNNIKQRWLVTIISDDPFEHGKEAVRNIHKFHSYGIPHIRDVYDDKSFLE